MKFPFFLNETFKNIRYSNHYDGTKMIEIDCQCQWSNFPLLLKSPLQLLDGQNESWYTSFPSAGAEYEHPTSNCFRTTRIELF